MRVPGTDQWRIEMADVIAGQDAAIGWNRLTETDAIYLAGREKNHTDQVPTDVAENPLWNLIFHLESPTRETAPAFSDVCKALCRSSNCSREVPPHPRVLAIASAVAP